MYKMTIPSIEQAPRENINQFQEEQLQHLMGYLQANSAFYRQVFQTYGVDPHSIRTLADLTRLPFTTKEQLQQDNLAFRCVATSQTADYVTTSGTSGDPVLLALTDKDRSEEHTSELQSRENLVCRLLLEKKNYN